MRYLKYFSRGFSNSLRYGVVVGFILGFLNLFTLLSAVNGGWFFTPITFSIYIPILAGLLFTGLPMLVISAIIGGVTGAIAGLMYALSSENNHQSHPNLRRSGFIVAGLLLGAIAAPLYTLVVQLPPIFIILGILATGIASGTYTTITAVYSKSTMISPPVHNPLVNDDEEITSSSTLEITHQLANIENKDYSIQPKSQNIPSEIIDSSMKTKFFKSTQDAVMCDDDKPVRQLTLR